MSFPPPTIPTIPQTNPSPPTNTRTEAIAQASQFLRDPRSLSAGAPRAIDFLRSKGLSDVEIQQAFTQAGRLSDYYQQQQSVAIGGRIRGDEHRRGGWGSWLMSIGMVAGGLYMLREFLKTYIVPLYFPEVAERERCRRSVLNREAVGKNVRELVRAIGGSAEIERRDEIDGESLKELTEAVKMLNRTLTERKGNVVVNSGSSEDLLGKLEALRKEVESLKRESRGVSAGESGSISGNVEREVTISGNDHNEQTAPLTISDVSNGIRQDGSNDETRPNSLPTPKTCRLDENDSHKVARRKSTSTSRAPLILQAGGDEDSLKIDDVVGPMTDTSVPHSPTSVNPVSATNQYASTPPSARSRVVDSEMKGDTDALNTQTTKKKEASHTGFDRLKTPQESQRSQSRGFGKAADESSTNTRTGEGESSPQGSVTRYSNGEEKHLEKNNVDTITKIKSRKAHAAGRKNGVSATNSKKEESVIDSPQLAEYARDLQAESNSGLALISNQKSKADNDDSGNRKNSPSGVRTFRGESIVVPNNNHDIRGPSGERTSGGRSSRGTRKRMGVRLSREEAERVPVNGNASVGADDDDAFMKISPAQVEKSWTKTSVVQTNNSEATRLSREEQRKRGKGSAGTNGVQQRGSSSSVRQDTSWIRRKAKIADKETIHSEESMDKDETTPLLRASALEEAQRRFRNALIQKAAEGPLTATEHALKQWRVQSAPGVETDLP